MSAPTQVLPPISDRARDRFQRATDANMVKWQEAGWLRGTLDCTRPGGRFGTLTPAQAIKEVREITQDADEAVAYLRAGGVL